MKGDPSWDSNLLSEAEKEEIHQEVIESREYKAFAARPNERSAAKTCAELLKVIETKVCCDIIYFLVITLITLPGR